MLGTRSHISRTRHAVKDCCIVDQEHAEKVYLQCICNAFDVKKHAYKVQGVDVWCTLETGREIDYDVLDTVRETSFVMLHHKPHRKH